MIKDIKIIKVHRNNIPQIFPCLLIFLLRPLPQSSDDLLLFYLTNVIWVILWVVLSPVSILLRSPASLRYPGIYTVHLILLLFVNPMILASSYKFHKSPFVLIRLFRVLGIIVQTHQMLY